MAPDFPVPSEERQDITVEVTTVPTHGIKVLPGDHYLWQHTVSCRSGLSHKKGTGLFVWLATQDAPHDEKTDHGTQWVCQTNLDTSVWATLESCIHRGLLKKVEPLLL